MASSCCSTRTDGCADDGEWCACRRGAAPPVVLSEPPLPVATFCASIAAAASAGTPPLPLPDAVDPAPATLCHDSCRRPLAVPSALLAPLALPPSRLGAPCCCATAAIVSSGKMRRLCRSKNEATIFSRERRASSSCCGSETTTYRLCTISWYIYESGCLRCSAHHCDKLSASPRASRASSSAPVCRSHVPMPSVSAVAPT
mmetsp:Transcript_3444/g.10763  ORF Transcript_3444/g.10763 Transcript_3444/m.10763 type:complete len:201 (-) Transcript_3444:26-628(-)